MSELFSYTGLSYELVITIAIILLGIFLFVKEYFSIDTTSILIMSLFIVSAVLSPQEGFSGFINTATITVACMFVLSFAVFKSGLLNPIIRLLTVLGRIHYFFALLSIILVSGLFSAFINDTAVVALLMPVVLQMAKSMKIPAGRLLMPLSFGALLGGVCTLIGTSTNILVSGITESYGLTPFTMFEFTRPAIILTAAGVLYMVTIGALLLPGRKSENTEGSFEESLSDYIVEIKVLKNAADNGVAIGKSKLKNDYNVAILSVKKKYETIYSPNDDYILQENDELKITTSPENLLKIRSETNLEIKNDEKLLGNFGVLKTTAKNPEKLYKALIPAGSMFSGSSLADLYFGNRYNSNVLAIRRRDGILQGNISNISLKEGDMLLLITKSEVLKRLHENGDLLIVNYYDPPQKINYKKAIPALLILTGVITAAVLNVAPIVITAMVGCLLLITTRIIKPEEAYNAIEWKVIFMLAGVLSMGTALQKTGGAEMIGAQISSLMNGSSPHALLAVVFLITFVATNVMSNNATAALMAPIAINIAQAMHYSERPFLLAVMFAASLSFMTPMSYQTNSMIYVPGNYRFSDYLKVGTPLNLIIWAIAVYVIPKYFPF